MKLIQETVKIEYDGKFYYRKHFAPEKLTVWSSDTGRQLPDEVVLELEKEYSKYCTGFDISNNDQANGETLGEGNPVGQVGDELIGDLSLLYLSLDMNSYFTHERNERLKAFISNVVNKPRTTDKEQPIIKNQCSCKKPHYGFKSISICTDCNGIKDDAYWTALKKNKVDDTV